MPDLHIYVSPRGCGQWPRWVIRNNRGELWTGDGWAEKPTEALLFHSDEEATEKAIELNRESCQRLFVCSMALRVESDKPFSAEELKDFLDRCFRGLLLEGDFDGAKIEVEVGWDEIQEIP